MKLSRRAVFAKISAQSHRMLRYWTAGESHGKALIALVDGFPAGVKIETDSIDVELRRRQGGYGRGGRQRIETDQVEILSGIWHGETLGSPIALQVVNKDYKLERLDDLPRPRPGHGDLTGAIKYLGSIRGMLERASARETAVRVAAGALAKQLLEQFGITAFGYVVELGGVAIDPAARHARRAAGAARCERSLFAQSRPGRRDQSADRRMRQRRRHAGRHRRSARRRACRSAWARTPSGTASSTAGWPRP